MVYYDRFSSVDVRIATQLRNETWLKYRTRTNDMDHLSNLTACLNYVRISREFVNTLGEGSSLLDWGCGYGQILYLTKLFGLRGIGFEIAQRAVSPEIFEELDMRYSPDELNLPFSDGEFDGVISCGTLEHVKDVNFSLKEIHRILKPKGKFLLYYLPNKSSWVETLNTIRRRSDHPVKYTRKLIVKLLNSLGFKISEMKSANLLPKNFSAMPILRNLNNLNPVMMLQFDRKLCKIPGINVFAGVHEIIAVKS